MTNYFVKIRKALKDEGFKVQKRVQKFRVQESDKAKYIGTWLLVRDEKVVMMVSNHAWYKDNQCIAIDRADCFDKFRNCPIQLPLPKTDKEFNKFMKLVRSVRDDSKWYDISNSYLFDEWVDSY